MKREKALKIYRAYKVYRFKKHLSKRIAGRKILRWLVQKKQQQKAVVIQTHLRSYLAKGKVITLKANTVQA